MVCAFVAMRSRQKLLCGVVLLGGTDVDEMTIRNLVAPTSATAMRRGSRASTPPRTCSEHGPFFEMPEVSGRRTLAPEAVVAWCA